MSTVRDAFVAQFGEDHGDVDYLALMVGTYDEYVK